MGDYFAKIINFMRLVFPKKCSSYLDCCMPSSVQAIKLKLGKCVYCSPNIIHGSEPIFMSGVHIFFCGDLMDIFPSESAYFFRYDTLLIFIQK